MFNSLGSDIIEVERIEQNILRYGSRFLDRIFTPAEQNYCKKYKDASRHFAGRFAAKEAIVKALGTGISSQVSWLDIEIMNDGHGKPIVELSQKAQEHFGHPKLSLTISHCKEYALAVALCHS